MNKHAAIPDIMLNMSLSKTRTAPPNSDKFAPFMIVESDENILVDMQYHKNGIPDAPSNCYLRKDVYDMLKLAADRLPVGYKIKIYDAWRPFAVQKYLYVNYQNEIIKTYPNLSECEITKRVKEFISTPNDDMLNPPAHTTGGAVDVTIVDIYDTEINMGTKFDAFGESANTCFFEKTKLELIKTNRRLLYNIMLSVGFTNLPSEWWHYDFGDLFWSAITNNEPKYIGIFSEKDILTRL